MPTKSPKGRNKGAAMLPKDPVILLSYINTQLRDRYPSLSALAEAYETTPEEISAKLNAIDYHYDEKTNQFR